MPAPRRSISLAALVIPPAALLASVAVLVLGIWMTIAENDALVAALNSPDATAADVYGGQSRVVVAGAVLTAGILAVVISLATVAVTGTIRAFAPRLAPAAAPASDQEADGFGDIDDLDTDDLDTDDLDTEADLDGVEAEPRPAHPADAADPR